MEKRISTPPRNLFFSPSWNIKKAPNPGISQGKIAYSKVLTDNKLTVAILNKIGDFLQNSQNLRKVFLILTSIFAIAWASKIIYN